MELRFMKFGISLVIVVALLSCKDMGGEFIVPPEVKPLHELQTAPEHITIDEKKLVLWTYIWRDFQPIAPPDGHSLLAVVRVATVDSTALPPGLDADALWIVYGEQVWASWLQAPSHGTNSPYQIERFAKDGPKWGPHARVDAVVRVVRSDGTSSLLRAKDQLIHRTE
jgi:hypothetical protein